jgi:hypothetical protein
MPRSWSNQSDSEILLAPTDIETTLENSLVLPKKLKVHIHKIQNFQDYHTFGIPAMWEIEMEGPQLETSQETRSQKTSQQWWYMSVMPLTLEG